MANWLIEAWKQWRETYFTQHDRNRLRELEWDEDAQKRFLEAQIIHDRNIVENSDIKARFDTSNEISKQWIRDFLPELIWDSDSQLLNEFVSNERIHLVSDTEYLYYTQWDEDVLWFFRSTNWDIYVWYNYLAKYENDAVLWDNGEKYAAMEFHLHHTIIHEILHSMSAMNYLTWEIDGKRLYGGRRVWLRQHRWNKKWDYVWTWEWMNEAATESLAREILAMWYGTERLGHGKISRLEWQIKSYKGFINVIDKLNEIDHVENRDFWKAMLIRKRAKDKSVERNTPLFELIWKVNWRYENDWHIEFTRPNYYNLISNSMDFSLKLLNENITPRRIETDWIVDFITKKDINILKRYIRSQHRRLSDVFDKDLLTKDGKDFKKEILDAYTGR
jgi:hypothetical protein